MKRKATFAVLVVAVALLILPIILRYATVQNSPVLNAITVPVSESEKQRRDELAALTWKAIDQIDAYEKKFGMKFSQADRERMIAETLKSHREEREPASAPVSTGVRGR